MTKNDQVDHRYIPPTNFQAKSHPYVVLSRELVGQLEALITPTGWKKIERRELAHKNAPAQLQNMPTQTAQLTQTAQYLLSKINCARIDQKTHMSQTAHTLCCIKMSQHN